MADLDEENAAGEEDVVSITEFMDGMEAVEMEADLVLGGDEGKECTYEKGYMRRQAIFSCLTCAPDGNAGVCIACSLTCHDGHEKVVELWTKRKFRCDCGNAKFGLFECKLVKDKEPRNDANVYNQNYKGLYCTCHRPFPDPDAKAGERLGEMLMCVVCEDWFHEAHLGLLPSQQVPRDDDGNNAFDDVICPPCTTRCSFLYQYPQLLLPPAEAQETEEDDPVIAAEDAKEEEVPPSVSLGNGNGNEVVAHDPSPLATSGESSETFNRNGCSSSSRSRTESPTATEGKLESPVTAANSDIGKRKRSLGDGESICKLMQATRAEASQLPKIAGPSDATVSVGGVVDRQGAEAKANAAQAMFLAKSWREELCQCDACLALYKEKGVEFLPDGEDSIQVYEDKGQIKREEIKQREAGTALEFITKLNHVQKIEFAHGINDLATELGSFLAPFGQEGRTVTTADIYEFFDGMQQKRRRTT